MFGDRMQKNELPLIIVCDDKDMYNILSQERNTRLCP